MHSNLKKFIATPAIALAVLFITSCAGTSAAVKTGVKPYPLDVCIVSGEKLGEMGEPVVSEYEGQEIKFCCESCVSKFDKNPAKFLKQLEEPPFVFKPSNRRSTP